MVGVAPLGLVEDLAITVAASSTTHAVSHLWFAFGASFGASLSWAMMSSAVRGDGLDAVDRADLGHPLAVGFSPLVNAPSACCDATALAGGLLAAPRGA